MRQRHCANSMLQGDSLAMIPPWRVTDCADTPHCRWLQERVAHRALELMARAIRATAGPRQVLQSTRRSRRCLHDAQADTPWHTSAPLATNTGDNVNDRTGCAFSVTPKLLAWAKVYGHS